VLPPGERRYTYPIADRCLFYTVELWWYWSEAHQIYIRCSLIIAAVNGAYKDSDISIRFQTLVQKCRWYQSAFITFSFLPTLYLVAMATSLDRSSAPKTLSFGEKIAKISPADPELIVLLAIIKKI